MRKTAKVVAIILCSLILIAVCLISYLKFALPDVGLAPKISAPATADRIAHGKYLATNVCGCIVCHSSRNTGVFSSPVNPDSIGRGGEKFGHEDDFPGTLYPPNITPYNLKTWSDGEIFRAIVSGVAKDGSALFPLMPYPAYRTMDKDDILDIIAYLRTLPEQQSISPAHQLDFPLNLIVNTMPSKPELQKVPAETNTVEYGKYLTNAALCAICHTNEVDGKQVGESFAGNREFKIPNGKVYSANITPDNQTGIGLWTKDMFINRFKSVGDSSHPLPKVGKNQFQTVMPWSTLSGMKASDLAAIYDYLRTVKPVKNTFTRFIAAK